MSKRVIRGDASTRQVWISDVELLPHESQKVRNHSPDGFNWAYSGSGPAQLALALMLRYCTSRHEAERCYQAFKHNFVAIWEGDFTCDEQDVLSWLERWRKAYGG